MQTVTRVHVRSMIRRDMPEVLAIERDSFEYAWTEDDFLRTLRRNCCVGYAAERGDKVVGFMMYDLHKYKLEVLNFAVAPAFRRAGVGRAMVDKLKSKLPPYRRTLLTLDVREGNLPAQLFFAAQHFKAVEVLRNHFEDSGEDAYRMVYRLPAEAGDDTLPF